MLREYIRLAMTSIRAARTRSLFTMLGVIIGVAGVITTVSFGEGIKHQVVSQINHLGNDLITIKPGRLLDRDEAGNIKSVNLFSGVATSAITEKDVEAVSSNSNIESVAPLSLISGVPSKNQKDFKNGLVIATNENLPDIISQEVEFGNFFQDDASNKKVAVIGASVAEKMFEELVPLGKRFKLRGQEFVVMGVFEKFPSNPIAPEVDFNNALFIPEETGKKITDGNAQIYEILAKPKNPDNVAQTAAELTGKLKENRGGQEDFTILKQDDTLSVAGSILNIITTAVAAIAVISMVVGGVGIMNVMLASITERTREIGIRKAVGATNAQIRNQFMTEAIVLSVMGAMIGIVLSVLINIFIRIMTDLQPVITWPVVVISAVVSITVGIIFGVVPAVKAARKDPIDSLRSF